MLGIDHLLLSLKIDDAIGAILVHLGAGVWGSPSPSSASPRRWAPAWTSDQLQVQALGVLTCGLWTFGVTYLVMKKINRFFRFHVTPPTRA